MKFKTKEEIIHDSGCGGFGEDTRIGISWAFDSFAGRVEFYKKYRYDYEGFVRDYPKTKFSKEDEETLFNHYLNMNFLMYWNEWLFDYCFKM